MITDIFVSYTLRHDLKFKRSSMPPSEEGRFGFVILSPERVRRKIKWICDYIRAAGNDFKQAKLDALEPQITYTIRRDLTVAPAPEYLALAKQRSEPETASCHPQNRFKRHSGPLPEVELEGAPWRSTDIPILKVRERWILATDEDRQWIFYYRSRPTRWEAICYPTTVEAVLRALRERVSDLHGRYSGIDATALDIVQSWKINCYRSEE